MRPKLVPCSPFGNNERYSGVPGVHALFCDPEAAAAGATYSGVASGGGATLLSSAQWPDNWLILANGTPAEGLIEVPPTSTEYWKVHAQLRAPTECGWGSMNDAWLSKLERIQNPQLYSLFEHWSGRLESVARDTGSAHMLATTDSGASSPNASRQRYSNT